MKIADIAKIIEAVLFVAGDGVDRDEFKRIYDLSDKELNKCIDILKERYNEKTGVNIISYKNKLQLCSNPELADAVAEILNPIRERSLTKAALETIAIIAYKQPITRTEVEQVRGVNCDYAIQLLQSNNLIEVVGRKDAVGKPLLFGTTDNFLKRFGLENLDALPNYRELLDRIRVIHSEGDSLYREFGIPDEQEDSTSVEAEDTTNQTESVENEDDKTIENSDKQQVESDKNINNQQTKVAKPKQSKKAKKEQNDINVEEIITEPSNEIVKPNVENDNKNEKVKKSQTKKSNHGVTISKIDNNQDVDKTDTQEKSEAKISVKSKQKEIKQDEIVEPKKIVEEIKVETPVASRKEKVTNKVEDVEVEREGQSVSEQPKLSWRDKMRAKMEANSHHYENLNDYIENRKD